MLLKKVKCKGISDTHWKGLYMDTRDKYNLLKKSADAQYYKSYLIFFLTLFFLSIVFVLFGYYSIRRLIIIEVGMIFCIVYILPVIIYAYNLIWILCKPSQYSFFECDLHDLYSDSPRTMYFAVKIRCADGRIIKKNTNAIFTTGFLFGSSVEEYNGKRALIAYDDSKERIVVVKLIQNK